MSSTPWYHLLANRTYIKAFSFIGPSISEREKLIEDGYSEEVDENGELTEACK
jgi:hypothetical protein